MGMTRVLLIHQPVDGGVGRHVADLARGLPGLGFETITCGPAPPAGIDGGREHVPLDLRRSVSPRDLRMVAEFARILDRVRPDIVHAHSSKAGAVARLAKLTHRRIPVLYTPHGFAFAGHFRLRAERRAYRDAEWALGRLTDRAVCVCQAEARLARLVVPPARVRVVYNGVPAADDGVPAAGDGVPAAGDGHVVDAMERLGRRGPIVCTLGLMRAGKGVESLIDAAPTVLARHPQAGFAIWGDGPETEALSQRARLRGVADAVHFLGPTTDPVAAVRGSTVFVMPSWRESFPYVVLEAMSAGLPIVSTDVGGVREAIGHEQHGLLVPPNDPGSLAQAISRMLADEDLRARLGAAAHERAGSQFTQQRMLSGLGALYTEILGFGRF
jgi:glycosyltransferase involved in cell wall biosynthesis